MAFNGYLIKIGGSNGTILPMKFIKYEEYKISTYNAGLMALAWLYNYERPGDPGATKQDRIDAANYWYGILSQYGPGGRQPWKWLALKRGAKVGYIRRKRLFRY